jgi:malate dehydrogenase
LGQAVLHGAEDVRLGAGHIPYALAPLIARGLMLGVDTPVIIHLYDKPAALNVLHAVRLELLDMALPCLAGKASLP